jgi:hypothetical protein
MTDRKNTRIAENDDDDIDEIGDSEDTLPAAPVISEQDRLPPGYEYKDFLRLNGPNTLYRFKSESRGINSPSKRYLHGCLIPKDIAPPLMIEHADNPNKTCIDPSDGKLKFYVETVRRIVKIDSDKSDKTVIHVEGGEVPFTPPLNPHEFIGRQPLRPEQVVVRGLRAKAEAKEAASSTTAKKK